MNTYPENIPLPTSIDESFYKAQIRTPFADGSVQTRPKHTRGRGKWDLSYDGISIIDAYILRDFFYANQGDLFNWENPMNNTTYIVRFSEDELQVKIQSPYNCSLSVLIEEA